METLEEELLKFSNDIRLQDDITIIEGRLLESLEKHDKEVSGRCKQAVKDVGLK